MADGTASGPPGIWQGIPDVSQVFAIQSSAGVDRNQDCRISASRALSAVRSIQTIRDTGPTFTCNS